MEAVISGQAGVALLVDGDALSSIHVHDPTTIVARRAGEFHFLFGAASDLVFVEDVSADEVRQTLQAAADGEDVAQLTLLLLAPDRAEEVRRTAAEELAELLTANPQAAAFSERLLNDWIGFHIRGMCLLKLGRLAEAIKVFEVGVERCFWPRQRDYFASGLAIASLRQGKNDEASRVLIEVDKRHAELAARNEIVVAPGPLLVRVHVWGVCGDAERAQQTFERLPESLPQTEQETKDELEHRHILHLPPKQSDAWLIDRLCDCLLAA
jgi:tetratricopeptide (TPR) repeat protein